MNKKVKMLLGVLAILVIFGLILKHKNTIMKHTTTTLYNPSKQNTPNVHVVSTSTTYVAPHSNAYKQQYYNY